MCHLAWLSPSMVLLSCRDDSYVNRTSRNYQGRLSKNIRQLYFEKQPLMCLREVDGMIGGVE